MRLDRSGLAGDGIVTDSLTYMLPTAGLLLVSATVSALFAPAFFYPAAKTFVGKKPRTLCRITSAGRKAFAEHIDWLEGIIKADK